MSRVVVIGAGMGGLAAAARLSAQGHEVLVVEQAETWGGKLATYERDGFAFDTGPSLLTLPAVYRDLFLKTAVRRAGASLEECVDLQPLDPAFSYRWSDGATAVLPGAGPALAADALGVGLGRHGRRRLAPLHGARRRDLARDPHPVPGDPAVRSADLVRQTWRLNDLRTIAPWSTLRGVGRGYFGDPRLVTLLDRYATYTGSDPRRAPAALAVVPYVEQTFGAWHVGGGLRRLGDALQAALRRARRSASGSSADVAEVLVEGGRAVGVRLVGRRGARRRRRRRERRRHATSTGPRRRPATRASAGERCASAPPVAVRLRDAARGPWPHTRCAPPQRAVPRRLRRRVRRDLRPRPHPVRRPDRLRRAPRTTR